MTAAPTSPPATGTSPATASPAPAKVVVNQATSQFLDLSRWFAAFVVVLCHVRGLVLADYGDIAGPPSLAVKAIYFAAGFGHEAVVVFFVISGFLVGGRSTVKAARGRFSMLDYVVHRFARIYIVLAPALLAGLLLDRAGSLLVDDTGLYAHLGRYHFLSIPGAVTSDLGPDTIIGNLLMLQTILVPTLGSNGPLWSLASEWWYYVLFGLAVGIALTRGRTARIICGVAFAVLLWVLPIGISLWAVLWVMGIGVALLEQRWRGWPAPVGAAAFLGVLVVARVLQRAEAQDGTTSVLAQFPLDLMVAFGFSLALLCAKRGWWGTGRLNTTLASFSYTTYLVHFPAMVFLATLAHRLLGFGIAEQPGLAGIGFMLAMLLCLYAYAWTFASLTEARTEHARKWLHQILDTLPAMRRGTLPRTAAATTPPVKPGRV